MNLNEFQSMLNSTYLSHNQQERDKGWDSLLLFLKNNPKGFSQTCCEVISSEGTPNNLRQITLTALSQAINPSKKEGALPTIWTELDLQDMEMIKKSGFCGLISSEDSIKRGSAKLIAGVFTMQKLQSEAENNIIEVLSSNIDHADQEIQKAAIYSLNYICESLAENKQIRISDEELDRLMYGIFKGLEGISYLTLESLKALSFSVSFIIVKMSDVKASEFIFDKLIRILRQANDWEKVDIATETIQVLGEICEQFYINLGKYFHMIFSEIFESKKLAKQSPNLLIAILNFFHNMA